MIRALLARTKTQTRRIVKGLALDWLTDARFTPEFVADKANHLCPYGQPGDKLWVRENGWERPERTPKMMREGADTWEPYYFDAAGLLWHDAEDFKAWGFKRRPSIHMPRWASRITLEITDVRVERLQDISEADAIAEGCEASPFPGPWWQGYRDMGDGEMLHQQTIGEAPPDWMIEPKRMRDLSRLDRSAVDGYRSLWTSINGPGSWDANPYVWAVSFRRLDGGTAG